MDSLATFLKDSLTGRDIKEIRKFLGVSQDKFATMIGVVGQTVYNWEAMKAEKAKISKENQTRILMLITEFLEYGNTGVSEQ